MTTILGIDIKARIGAAIASKGGLQDGTLTVVTPGTRTPGALTAGTNPTTTTATFQGTVDDYRDSEIDGTLIVAGDWRAIILAATVQDSVVPSPTDRITLGGRTGEIVAVSTSPGGSNHVCHVRGR